ncbi:MAG TPA: aspartate-alanine antiporter [Geminicoccaceae bacterium]|nr:aspartate-alanine antiporter [Geminicoccus sp.]HMU52108.1 aspartate-alanine antiporter [Geminicoccaceae bacterium]
MVDWVVGILHRYPEIAFFLTLAIGYLIGKIKVAGFGLGAVTGTLLAGVLVGQLGITLAPAVKQVFFLLFLFSIGYRTGPQFFRGLKSDGLASVGLTVLLCVVGLLTGWLAALLLGFDIGTAAGLLGGALTESATIGTAADAISRLPIDDAAKTALTNHIAVAFAVSYLVGVVAVAWFHSQISPRLMGVDLAAECRKLEQEMAGGPTEPAGTVSARRLFEVRAYRIEPGSPLLGAPVGERLPGMRVFVERVRRGEQLMTADVTTVLQPGDVVSISGPRSVLVDKLDPMMPEVEDRELLDQPAEIVDVFVTSRDVGRRTLAEAADEPWARGVFLRKITRGGVELLHNPGTRIMRGDVLTLVGSPAHIAAAVPHIGTATRASEATDMVTVGLGIVVGALVGIPAFHIGALDIGLSASVGALLGGLILGWARSLHPTFGNVPGPALWLFESVGLAGFVAVTGLAAGPDFVRGVAESGLGLLLAAFVVALVPHALTVIVGHKLVGMHPGLLLGVCTGAGTATPALAAVQEVAQSRVPTLSYGVSYAVGNVLLALWGTVIVMLMG